MFACKDDNDKLLAFVVSVVVVAIVVRMLPPRLIW